MNREIIIPTECPCCGYPLEEINGQLFCRTIDCSAKVSKTLTHFAKVLKIKGLGEKTIEKLNFESINDIYTTPASVYKDILGEATATKIIEFIKQSQKVNLQELLPALAIPGFGSVAAEKLCKVLKYLPDLNKEVCQQAGLGNVVTEKLLLWWDLNKDEVMQLPFTFRMPEKVETTPKLEQAVVVCITGLLNDFKNRDEAKAHLESLGFTVTDSVTQKVNVLINEDDRQSTKKDKALKLNIPILTIKQLIERYTKV
jgi:DNA ligase (NAD+)